LIHLSQINLMSDLSMQPIIWSNLMFPINRYTVLYTLMLRINRYTVLYTLMLHIIRYTVLYTLMLHISRYNRSLYTDVTY
jgi:hypothetical protein